MRHSITTIGFVCCMFAESAIGQTCTITFDGACPTAVSQQCGAFFDGGGGCIFAGLLFCYDTGTRSYKVTDATPLSITIPDGLSALEVFFSEQGGVASGEMRFFDAEIGGSEVDAPLASNGNCLAFMPPRQSIVFTSIVHRIEVTATGGTVWIDTFIATPPSDCSGVNDCSGNGTCIALDTCQCDSGWMGADCSTPTCVGVNDCSGNGTCTAPDTCLCDAGWEGVDCSTFNCTDVNNCSANGTCIGANTCQCDAGWMGADCSTATCAGVNDCSGNGTCIAPDSCQCDSGWEGADCSTFNCSGVNDCSANGTCIGANNCDCNKGFAGADCSVAIPAVSQWGLVTMSLLVLTAGTVLLGRRRKLLG